MKILFLGGPGNISESSIRHFLKSGHEVAVIKRSQGGLLGLDEYITVYYGDRDNEEFLAGVMKEYAPEIVIDCTCFECEQAETVIKAIRQKPCRRLIFISTADVYGYPLCHLPQRENDPWTDTNCDYAEFKKQIEGIYRNAFEGTETSVTIIRPSYSMGKTFALTSFERDRGAYLVTRLRQGKPIYSPGDGTTLIDANAAYTTGVMIAMIAEDDRTCGEDYNCCNNRAVTYDEYINAFAKAVGVEPNIVHVPTDFMFSLEREEVTNSILNDLAKYNLYFSCEKFAKTFPEFKWDYTLEDAARDFIRYQESIGGLEGTEQLMFEDKVVDCWLKLMQDAREYVNKNV